MIDLYILYEKNLSSSSSSTENCPRFVRFGSGKKRKDSVRFGFEKKFQRLVRVRFDVKNQGSTHH